MNIKNYKSDCDSAVLKNRVNTLMDMPHLRIKLSIRARVLKNVLE